MSRSTNTDRNGRPDVSGSRELAARASAAVAAAAGVWLLVAPFVYYESEAAEAGGALTNDLTVGTIVAGAAIARIVRPFVARPTAWLTALAGVWLAVSPLIIGHGGAAAKNDVGTGIVVVLTAIVGIVSVPRVSPVVGTDHRSLDERAVAGGRHAVVFAVLIALAVVAIVVGALLSQ